MNVHSLSLARPNKMPTSVSFSNNTCMNLRFKVRIYKRYWSTKTKGNNDFCKAQIASFVHLPFIPLQLFELSLG